MTLPRILHIGFNPIGTQTNTGLTLGSVFSTWPRESLFELYLQSGQTSGVAGQNRLVMPRGVAPIDGLLRQVVGGRLRLPASDGMNTSIANRGRSLPWKYRMRMRAATLNEVGPVFTRGSWLKAVRDYEPQVIHSLLGSVRSCKVVSSLARKLSIPVVPHFMDDWPSAMFADGQLLGYPRHQVEKSLAGVLALSPICLTIGDDMKAEFEKRYERPCWVVGNGIDPAAFRSIQPAALPDPPEFVYVGGLHLGRDRVLAGLLPALDRAGVVMKVFCAPEDFVRLQNLTAGPRDRLVFGGHVGRDEVPEALMRSDVLVFVESDDERILPFSRLSVSTKVPEYLAARRPILAVGPDNQASMRMLKRGPATVAVSEPGAPELAEGIARLLAIRAVPTAPLQADLAAKIEVEQVRRAFEAAMVFAAGRG